MTALNRLVTAVDRSRSSPRLLEVTSREVAVRRICLACRRSPDYVNRIKWMGELCPLCRGRLIEVSW